MSRTFRNYYKNVFPHETVFSFISRGGALAESREISFECEKRGGRGTYYKRYNAARNAEELRQLLTENRVTKYDIGAERRPPFGKGSDVRGRELVFDIDLSDYDDVRVCCQDKTMCVCCWPIAVAAARLLDSRLRDDFLYKHIEWVFSGRRGLHCWVLDNDAFMAPRVFREEALELLRAKVDYDRALVLECFSDVLHAQRYHMYGELAFEKATGGLLSKEAWAAFCENGDSELASLRRCIQVYHKKNVEESNDVLFEIAARCVVPRLDEQVTKDMGHLVKGPFSLHPATKRVCMPLTVCEMPQFSFSTAFTPQKVRQRAIEFEKRLPWNRQHVAQTV